VWRGYIKRLTVLCGIVIVLAITLRVWPEERRCDRYYRQVMTEQQPGLGNSDRLSPAERARHTRCRQQISDRQLRRERDRRAGLLAMAGLAAGPVESAKQPSAPESGRQDP